MLALHRVDCQRKPKPQTAPDRNPGKSSYPAYLTSWCCCSTTNGERITGGYLQGTSTHQIPSHISKLSLRCDPATCCDHGHGILDRQEVQALRRYARNSTPLLESLLAKRARVPICAAGARHVVQKSAWALILCRRRIVGIILTEVCSIQQHCHGVTARPQVIFHELQLINGRQQRGSENRTQNRRCYPSSY